MRRFVILSLCASLFFFHVQAQEDADTDADTETETQPEAQFEALPETRVGYRVDAEGGPATLAEEVAAAFAVWAGVEGADFTAAEVEEGEAGEAEAVLRYGDASRFGPDTVSLTAASTEPGDAARRISVLLNPAADAFRPAALLHEAGVLAGVPASPTATGVMNPLLPADPVAELSEADRAALTSLRDFAPEDLDRDGVVGFYDLARFAAAFGGTGVNLEGDFNNDGVVDEADLERLRAAYMFSPPSETAPATLSTEEDVTGGDVTGGLGELGEFDESVFDFGTGGDLTGGADVGGDAEGGATGGADTGGAGSGDADEGDIEDTTGGATGGG